MASTTNTRHLLITGSPGVGKTTLLCRLCELVKKTYPDIVCNGFYTKEVREHGFRIGFDVISIDQIQQQRSELARIDKYSHGGCRHPRIGQYNVFVENFEQIAIPILNSIQPPCICFIDEIGKMELFSEKFKQIIHSIIEQDNIILVATIPIKPVAFVDRIRIRRDCQLLTVTKENRGSNLEIDLLAKIKHSYDIQYVRVQQVNTGIQRHAVIGQGWQTCNNLTSGASALPCDQTLGLSCYSNFSCQCASTMYWDRNYLICQTKKLYTDICDGNFYCNETLNLICPTVPNTCNCPTFSSDYTCDCQPNWFYDGIRCVNRKSINGTCPGSYACDIYTPLVCAYGVCTW
ncbi:unnamed protein product [Didymodactylos carnosus]|nr:unnamed protein product [Didymodactylos carnosus]CAF3855546.1 unnamed protein product [Didymodactylos carnosus]